MDIVQASIADMTRFLQAHTALAYVVLFLGAYFDALVGVGFFVFGELFFLPGAILAGSGVLNVWLVTVALMSGGALGDTSSYVIGVRYGEDLFRKDGKLFSRRNYEKGKAFFQKYGVKGIFFARLLGPLSWVTPFFAGMSKVPYRRFIAYNIFGVIVGIGEFIVVGYFFGRHYGVVLSFLQRYVAAIVFVAVFLLIVYYTLKKMFPDALNTIRTYWRHEKKKLIKGLFKYATYYMFLFVLLYVGFLYFILFVDLDYDGHPPPPAPQATYGSLAAIRSHTDFVAYADASDEIPVQPVNVVLVTNRNIASLFKSKGWIQDVIFSRQKLTPASLYRLWEQHVPPVSDLYVNGRPQGIAFQNYTGSSFSRLHIRFWKMGRLARNDATIYVGSVSYDQGIDIVPYRHFFVPLHAVDADIDKARDRIRTLFKNDAALRSYRYEPWGQAVARSEDEEAYYTDGRVLVLNFDANAARVGSGSRSARPPMIRPRSSEPP